MGDRVGKKPPQPPVQHLPEEVVTVGKKKEEGKKTPPIDLDTSPVKSVFKNSDPGKLLEGTLGGKRAPSPGPKTTMPKTTETTIPLGSMETKGGGGYGAGAGTISPSEKKESPVEMAPTPGHYDDMQDAKARGPKDLEAKKIKSGDTVHIGGMQYTVVVTGEAISFKKP